MAELELSIMRRSPTTEADMRRLLEPFEAESRVQVRLRILAWETAWADLLKVALYQYGPDVSEIGTTWLSSLVAMDALQPFTGFKVQAFGDAAAFLPALWLSGQIAQRPYEPAVAWAVPWWADSRLLYYRRDILAEAGVQEAEAFDNAQHLAQTLEKLQAAGVPVPWVVPTNQSHMTVHNVASWVWGAGGRFVSDDGRHALFAEPAARAGIKAYLELGRFLAESVRGLDDTQSDALYANEDIAVTVSGPWLLRDASASSRALSHSVMTLPPGIPFVGGSHLVMWRHAGHETAAVKLIRFLTSQKFQAAYGRHTGLMPTRQDVVSMPPFAEDLLYRILAQGLQYGRTFPVVPLWGLVEEELNEALGRLWADLLANEDLDLEKAIAGRLVPLARKLNLTLGSR